MNNKLIEIQQLVKEYKSFSKKVVDYEKHAYFVSTFHSTGIEGSTLTEMEVFRLILDGKTANNKPYEHHLMVTDYYGALLNVIETSALKKDLSVNYIQQISSLILKNTGSIHKTILGSFDSSKGEFRKLNVFAGKTRFPDHSKVKKMTQDLVKEVNAQIKQKLSFQQKLELSFYVHFHLVQIHPFVDGNGRLSRLMMNYIQNYFGLPISNVFKNDRPKYIDTLIQAKRDENIEVFYNFMYNQYKKFLKAEIKSLS